MNEIAGRYGRVIGGSTADTWDQNLAMDIVGVLVHQGKKVEEKIGITWKGQRFDVWISEIDDSWAPSFISKANEKLSPGISGKNDANMPENQKKPDKQAISVIPPTIEGMSSQVSPGKNERSGEVESSQGSPRKEENSKKSKNIGFEKTDTIPNVLPPKEINIGDNSNNDCTQVESLPEVHVGVLGNKSNEPFGPAQDDYNVHNELAQKKRKRSLIADVRNNALKPCSQVRKHARI
ncbi:hypothetical protein Hanom_Chr06g00518741 [Helianthus anomalus]